MHLKSVEIQGFKSFAHKTRFDFMGGITGIVGPNGSGKSNVADAVRWVFGEQSAKQLRGSNMQDVIFAGTEIRRPMSYASVSITLDNADRALLTDADEVTVTRRVYRSGESEYIINGNQCRLRDINELFYDTGIGKEGYSIIGQGQVDKILSGKADDRRELFDEAAGIMKFKKRKAAAMRKLENERANMVRVTDILTELEKQAGPLKRQSEVARQYLKLRETQKIYDVTAFLLDSDTNSELLRKSAEDLSIVDHNLEENTAKLEQLKNQYADVEASLAKLDADTEEVRDRLMEAGSDRTRLEGEIRVLNEKIASETGSQALLSERAAALRASSEGKAAEMERTSRELSEGLGKAAEMEAELQTLQADLRGFNEKVALYRGTIEERHGQTIDIMNEKSAAGARLAEIETLLSGNASRTEEYEKRLREIVGRAKENREQLASKESEASEIRVSAAALEESVSSLEEEKRGLDSAYASLVDAFNTDQQRYQASRSRYETLKAVRERYDGYQNAVRKLMELKKTRPGIHGVVADLFTTDEKYRTAVETALGGNYQNVVVEDERTAKSLIGWLKDQKEGRATFLPLDTVTPSADTFDGALLKEPGVLGSCESFVRTDPAYRKVASFLLGRVLLADTMDHAAEIARRHRYRLRIVTLDGELLSPGGSITGGAFRMKSSVLNRNEELNRVLREAEQFKAQAATLQKEIQLKKQLLDSTALELEDVKAEYAELQIRERTLRAELDSLRRDATALSMQEKEGNTAIRELKAKTESLSAEKRAVVSVLGDLERVTASSDDSLEETRKLLKQAIDERAVLQAEIEEKQLALSTLRSGNGFAEETVSRLRREMEEAEEEIGTVLQQGASSETLVSGYRERIALLEEQLEEERAAHASLEDALADLNGKREKAQREQRVYFERRESYSETESTLTREKLRLEAIIERAEEKLDAAVEYIWQEYGLTPEEAARFNDDSLKGETPQEIRKNANRLRSQIKALGHVNVNAIEAYAEISERYEYLKAQHEDLKKAEEALTGIITDLDNGMRKQFREKFAEIRTEYDKVFRELFGGGRGTIEIDEKADIIDADITIISQPPGKKLQNMLQLSGGEKALSAIALIFAIQNLKPSPFALLDEIEAALDDANVGRFTGYLKKLTARTQFIVITHRRGTMVSCDRLYGITMQEKGVSTLVSVSLVEHELDA